VDRRALPAPDEAPAEAQPAADAPLTEVESVLAEIWREVIGLEEVRPVDNFFDLGGHSVLVTQMLTRVRRAFGVELTLRNVFETPSMGELARIIELQLLEEVTHASESELAQVSKE
jgi:acyl carrier protein